ncbi:MAG: right-handed parallel beta-helix repeat-containing protein [Fibrobacterota bacterium]|nr:right-handed parallel beta-helix repeat-containing protein [Fibrobacterota bacterium]
MTTRNFDDLANVLEPMAKGIEGHDDQISAVADKVAKLIPPAILGRGKIYDVRSFGTLQAAVTYLGANTATLYVTDAQILTANLTIPSTISLVVLKGGTIDGAFTLTLNGSFEAGLFQVFGGAVSVVFGNVSIRQIPAPWFGAVGNGSTNDRTAIINAGVAAEAAGAAVYFPKGTYFISASVTFNHDVIFDPGAILYWTSTSAEVQFKTINAGPYHIFDFPISTPPFFIKDGRWLAKWFSSLPYACAALATGDTLFLHDGDYPLTATIDLSNKGMISIEGETPRGVRIIPNAVLGSMFLFNNDSGYTHTGTAVAGTANTITLNGLNAFDTFENYYVNSSIEITAGTGAGQIRSPIASVVATRVVTVSVPWTTVPDATSQYSVTQRATQREVFLKRLTFISSASYGICDYAVRAIWTPEFHMEEVHFINVSRVYSVLFTTTFVTEMSKCIGHGRLTGTALGQWGVSTVHASAGGGGFYCESTSTTVKIDTCRFSIYEVGVYVNGCDVLTVLNSAIESCTVGAILIAGSSLNVNIIGCYFEGNNGGSVYDVRFSATCDAAKIEGNFIHGSSVGVRLDTGVEIYNLAIRDNDFYSGSTGIYDAGARTRQLIVENNTFRDLTETFLFTHGTPTTESTKRMVWRHNRFPNAPEILSDSHDMDGQDLTNWTASGGATITLNAIQYLNDSVWRVAGVGAAAISRTVFSITSTSNFNVRSQFITVTIPILADGAANPEATISDGVTTRSYILTATTTAWKQNVLYIQMGASATGLTITIIPAGGNIFVGRPAVRLGMYDEHGGGSTGSPASGGANPTATIGLTATNGTALTMMRSDAAPALNQGIIPEWTQNHAFQKRIEFSDFGVAVAGSILRTAADGIVFRGADGSANNVVLQTSAGTTVLRIPTGTTGVTSDYDFNLAATRVLRVNGTQVVAAQQTGLGASLAARTAGVTYDATAQTMLQEAHDKIRLLEAQLKTHGLVAT